MTLTGFDRSFFDYSDRTSFVLSGYLDFNKSSF